MDVSSKDDRKTYQCVFTRDSYHSASENATLHIVSSDMETLSIKGKEICFQESVASKQQVTAINVTTLQCLENDLHRCKNISDSLSKGKECLSFPSDAFASPCEVLQISQEVVTASGLMGSNLQFFTYTEQTGFKSCFYEYPSLCCSTEDFLGNKELELNLQDVAFDGTNNRTRIGVVCNETCEIEVTYYDLINDTLVPDNDVKSENVTSPPEIHVLRERFFQVLAYHPSGSLCSGSVSTSTYYMLDRTEIFMVPFEPNANVKLPIPKANCNLDLLWPYNFNVQTSTRCQCPLASTSALCTDINRACSEDDIDVDPNNVILRNISSESGSFFVHFVCDIMDNDALFVSLDRSFYFKIIASYNLRDDRRQEEDDKLFFLLTVAGIPGGAVLMAVVAAILTGLCCCYCKDKRSYAIKQS